MKKRVLLLDLDGVIADFYKGFAEFLNENYGCYLPLDREPEEYYFSRWGHGIENVNIPEATNAWVRSDGFLNIPAYSGASEFTKRLSEKADVYVVTARVGDWQRNLPPDVVDKIREDTKKWLIKHDISFNKLFFAHEKIDFCDLHGIEIIIEDKPDTVMEASETGKQSVLVDRSYNRDFTQNGSNIYRAKDFEDILRHLDL